MTSSFNSSHNPRQEALFYRMATAGAGLRAAASATRGGAFAQLPLPRSAVILVGNRRAQLAAESVRALADDIRCPVVIAHRLPSYVGALDLVIVCDDNPGSPLGAALAEADRRGAATVVVDPGEGPLRAAGSPDTVVVPRPAMAESASFTAYVGAIASALTECGATTLAPAGVVEEVADAVDADIAACAPQRDETVNPARQVAQWVAGRRMLAVSTTSALAPVAELASLQMLEAGVVSAASSIGELSLSVGALLAAEPQESRDIFYDPFIDGGDEGATVLPLGAIVLAAPNNVGHYRDHYGEVGWARVECPALDAETHHPLVEVCVAAARVGAIAAFSA
ncbi:hypothetical protein HMPREF2708_00130 [Corynebacterium sp. HMSC073H12]|uniref:hypothetical protein n=1 Tax=Corynebacterium sp. HMSC073H12 TaxID=1715187 RepID=UPI0008A91199|nr:hypothetical protein [Corynebacterium sp. HMSC073H12]OHQ78024.1 hypothetical protein HMPREF2708_00130 [Corynebacterium sp. HMSC073H12]